MKRAVFLFSLIFICLAVSRVAFSQSDARLQARADAKKVCPFNIIGLWRSDAMTATNPVLFNFSPEGWVALLDHSADILPQDFEIITTVTYKLDKPAMPKRIEFTATRGNDVFPRGTTSMQIALYSDDSFTTVNPESGQRAEWVRLQTHRFFLTFTARNGPLQYGGPAFAMWTTLDGRHPKVEALGIQLFKDNEGRTLPVFGSIPAEVYDQLMEESEEARKKDDKSKDQTVRVCFELTQAEFEKTHMVYETWDKHVKAHKLPYRDPYLNGMEFFSSAAEGLNQCGAKADLHRLTRLERDEIISKHKSPQHLLEYIRITRKKNDELHVKDSEFPWGWRPILSLPGR